MAHNIDKELEEFRRIMEVPSTFEEGFRHPECVRGLEEFEYIWLIWQFDNKDDR